jgi:hypothetical protein
MPKYVAVSDAFPAEETCIIWDDGKIKRAHPMRHWIVDYSYEEPVEHFGETMEIALDKATEAQWYDQVILGVKNV